MEIHSSIIGPTLTKLRMQFGIKNFVETGTCHGDTAELGALIFDRVFTCEIDPNLFVEASRRLAGYPHAQIFQMESPAFLRQIRAELARPTIYWLDGHWCGGPVKPPKECPVLEELAEIGSLHGHSVILIDDVDYMMKPPPPPHDPNQWPTITAVQNALASWHVQTTIEQGPRSKVMIVTPEAPQ